ncbi:MAG TPA: serine hydrolase, partial [Symbiobacteriaceae bacterium]|nr:serine hydrolase [Symbiobacteriaceae bacterium]
EVILTALRGVTYTGRIAAGTPEPAQVTHKFGSVDDYFHDGAIVWAGRPYLLVVMTGEAGEGEADWVIEHVAAVVWEVFSP